MESITYLISGLGVLNRTSIEREAVRSSFFRTVIFKTSYIMGLITSYMEDFYWSDNEIL